PLFRSKKALLGSDNDAYNRMYEFVGQAEINRSLHAKGYPNVRITHRFVALTEEENRCTNPIRFVSENGDLILSQPPACNTDSFDFSRVEMVGRAHYRRGVLIEEPMNFSRKNRVPLRDLHNILLSVMFPEDVAADRRFQLTDDDYQFMYQYLSQFPGE